MQILSQLGLMFRATVLNQLGAKVRLASSHYSPSRFSAALIGIDNREQQLANLFSQGRLSVDQLSHKASRLASQDVLLNTRLQPESDCDGAVARQPVATAAAFRSVLVRAYFAAAEAKKEQLGALLAPDMVRARARCMLADAFWKGHIISSRELQAQVRQQAHLEAVDSACPLDQMKQVERRAASEILHFVAKQVPIHGDPETHALAAQLARAVRRLAVQAQGPETCANGAAVVGRHVQDEVVPPSWTRIALAFWEQAWPNFAEFQAAFIEARDQAIDPAGGDPHPAETRCHLTFKLIEYIRSHEQGLPHSGWQAVPSVLDAFAGKLERDAVDGVLVERGLPAPSPTPERWISSQQQELDSGYATPVAPAQGTRAALLDHDPNDSDHWSDGESDAGSVLI